MSRYHYHMQQLTCNIAIKTFSSADKTSKIYQSQKYRRALTAPVGWPQDNACLTQKLGRRNTASQNSAKGTLIVWGVYFLFYLNLCEIANE